MDPIKEAFSNVKQEIEASGGSVDILQLDNRNGDSISKRVEEIINLYEVYGLVNNAGVGHFGPFTEMNELEITIVNNVLFNYYKKHNKLPSYGHSLVSENVMIPGDMLDYMLDIKNNYIYIKYTYYKKSIEENKYVTSSIKLCKE